jgi:hypothetical protein
MTDLNSESTLSSTSHDLFAAAYARALPRLSAMRREELIPINLDIPAVVATALGVAPKINALRAQILETMPKTDMSLIDGLEDAARALFYVNARSEDSKTALSLASTAEKAFVVRTQLMRDVESLASYGLLDGSRLQHLRGGNAYRNVASDIVTLVDLFRGAWDAVKGRTPVTEQALDAAVELSNALVVGAGLREQADTDLQHHHDVERLRAYAWFMRCYEEARRALLHLRWHEGDADKIAPSLYSRRQKKGRANGNDTAPKAETSDANDVIAA